MKSEADFEPHSRRGRRSAGLPRTQQERMMAPAFLKLCEPSNHTHNDDQRLN
ncbi:unnamed protein product, partial [Trichogramma brassicae]